MILILSYTLEDPLGVSAVERGLQNRVVLRPKPSQQHFIIQ